MLRTSLLATAAALAVSTAAGAQSVPAAESADSADASIQAIESLIAQAGLVEASAVVRIAETSLAIADGDADPVEGSIAIASEVGELTYGISPLEIADTLLMADAPPDVPFQVQADDKTD